MRIKKVIIENIASLRGEHIVDFDRFGEDNSTYAITGETGAGKSTILNSISLALYGQNYKRALTQVDFVTLGEISGKITLEFIYDHQIYKAIWQCKVKKNNGEDLKVPKPKRELFQFTENKWNALELLPEAIIDLSFDQFCKTMILNQGEFANFLTSSFKERKDILEKFYDGEKLDLLSIKTRQKISELSHSIENKKHQIDGLEELSELNLEESKEKVFTLNSEKKISLLSQKKIDSILGRLKDINKYIEETDKSEKRIESLSTIIKETTQEVNDAKTKLSLKQEQVISFTKIYNQKEPLYLECINKLEQVKIFENEFHTIVTEIKDLNKKEDEKSKEAVLLKKEINSLEELKKTIKSNKDFLEISKDELKVIKDLYKDHQSITNEINLLNRRRQQDLDKNAEIQFEAEKIKSKLIEHKDYIKGLSKEELTSSINDLQLKLEELQRHENRYTQYCQNFESQSLKIKEFQHKKEKLTIEDKVNQKEKESLEIRISEVNHGLKYFQLLESINACKHENKNKSNCIVCNSPLIEENNQKEEFDDSEYLKLKESHESLKESLELLTDKENKYKLELNAITKTLENIESELYSQKQDILSSSLLENFSMDDEDKAIRDFFTSAKDKFKNHINKALEDINNLDKINFKISELEGQLQVLREKYSLNQKIVQKETDDISKFEEKILKIEDILKNDFKNIIFTENFSTTLELNSEFFSLIDKQNAKEDILASTGQSLKDIKETISTKNIKQNELKSKIDSLRDEILKHTEKKDPQVLLTELKNQNNELLSEEQKLNNIKTSSEVYLAELNSKFKSINEQVESYHQQIKILTSEIATLSKEKINEVYKMSEDSELYLIYKEHDPFISKLATINDSDFLNQSILQETILFATDLNSSFKVYLEKITEEATRLNTLIKQKEEAQEKIKSIKSETEALIKTKNQYQDLYDLIGRDEFRNYVLSIIEKNLILQTNHELTYLCDNRYKLIHITKSSKMSPDFYIIDKYKGGLTRKVSTLSGGETFMVSLAMAIALSELTRGKAQINSFFIDEGFGTLDEDSLEDVLDMINNIQARGKTIGIITHVKKLADRIPLNIRLKKSTQGNSSIKLIFQ